MIIKTKDLLGKQLDWAVAKAIGFREPFYNIGAIRLEEGDYLVMDKPDPDDYDEPKSHLYFTHYEQWSPSRIWSQCGALIEKYRMLFLVAGEGYAAYHPTSRPAFYINGPTHQVAACRLVVAWHLGQEVEIPEGLAV